MAQLIFLRVTASAVLARSAWLAAASSAWARAAAALCCAVYAWTYFDGAELRPAGRFARGVHARVARGWWATLSAFSAVEFDDDAAAAALAADESRRPLIFTCHPHGVMSFCHGQYCFPTPAPPAWRRMSYLGGRRESVFCCRLPLRRASVPLALPRGAPPRARHEAALPRAAHDSYIPMV